MYILLIIVLVCAFFKWFFSGPSHNLNGEINECIGCPYRKYGTSYCEENCKWHEQIKKQ